MVSCEVVSLRKLFGELFEQVLDTTMLYYNNKSGIWLEENPIFHDRSKHIDIRYDFIWDMVQWGAIRLHHIGTDEQVANILTKPRKGQILDFSRTTWSRWETLLWGYSMMHALSSRSSGGLGVLLGATSDHRATHPPLVVHCVQGEWFNLPLWYLVVTCGQDEWFSCRGILPMQSGTHGKYLSFGQCVGKWV